MDNPDKLATRRRQTKQKHNTICVGHYHTLKKIQITELRHESFYKKTGSKDEPNIVFMRIS